VNLAAALAKIIYGEITHSVAMGADGMHSALDVVASLIALVGISLATRPPDPRHPYGYDRYESVAALIIGGFLVLALVHILRGAISRLIRPEIIEVTWVSLAIMVVSILASGGLAWWEQSKSRVLRSELLHADAVHTGSDVLVSTAVLGGLVASSRGLVMVDALVALSVAGVIAWAAWGILRTATQVLTDAALVDVESIASLALSVPGVLDCHAVRARGPAGRVRVDLHIHVDPATRVDEAHDVADSVARVVRSQVPGIIEVLVHVGAAGMRRHE
jgi:cation diffusion facilitator family transporter